MLMQKRTNNYPAVINSVQTTSPVKLSDWIDEVIEDAFNWNRMGNGNFYPELNVYETDNEFEVAVALPGMHKDDINISYNSGMLTISGERKMEQESEGRRYHRVESHFGKFSRSLPIPSDVVNQEMITAKYENGVLNVSIPKKEEKAAKRIEIQ